MAVVPADIILDPGVGADPAASRQNPVNNYRLRRARCAGGRKEVMMIPAVSLSGEVGERLKPTVC